MMALRLVWGTTWRGGAWGLLVGTFAGATFGVLLAYVLEIGGGLLAQREPISLSDIPTLIAALAIFGILGAFMGALFGVPTGFVVGVANGLLLGIVSRIFFFPLTDIRGYRWVIGLISMAFTTLASWVGFMLIMFLYAN